MRRQDATHAALRFPELIRCPTQDAKGQMRHVSADQSFKTAVIIGQPDSCRRLEQQLDLLESRPVTIGWVVTQPQNALHDEPLLGSIDQLESIIAQRRPAVALISLPAAMKDLIASIRTRLRKLGIVERFMPTLEDQLAGIGPRSQIDVDLNQLIGRPARNIDETAIARVIRGRRVLITGAGGSIGSELSRVVAGFSPQSLTLIERSENALFEIDRQIARTSPNLRREALLHDVVDSDATLAHFLRIRPDVIFHAAAHKHVPMMEDHPAAAIDNNLFGTKSVADAAAAVEAERFVMISTDKAVNPVSVMGATKRLAELYVQQIKEQSPTGFAIVRFGNVLGSSGSVLDIWTRQIAEGGPLTVTDPRMTRYFMTIPEAAALVIQSAALMDPTAAGAEVFVLDMGEPVKVLDLAQRFAQMHGLDLVALSESSDAAAPGTIQLVCTGARPGEKLHEQLAIDPATLQPTSHPGINLLMLERPDSRYVQDALMRLSPRYRSREAAVLASSIRQLTGEQKQPAAA